MDPNANLTEQLRLAVAIVSAEAIDPAEACRLAELVLALDDWLCRGGCRPERWQRAA